MKDLFELNKTIRFDYTGQPEPLVLDLGVYDFECHGAQGCGPYGGYGGVMAGRYTAVSPITLWMYIGNTLTSNVGGWNGGGTGAMLYGGGGATDIALLYGEWDSVEHLYSRILVAGGVADAQLKTMEVLANIFLYGMEVKVVENMAIMAVDQVMDMAQVLTMQDILHGIIAQEQVALDMVEELETGILSI